MKVTLLGDFVVEGDKIKERYFEEIERYFTDKNIVSYVILESPFVTKGMRKVTLKANAKRVVHPFLINLSYNHVHNYKILCFHGKPYHLQTTFDRQEDVEEDLYDTEGDLCDVHYFSTKKKNIQKPKLLNKILSVVTRLSREYRVDLHIAKNKIYFGELTFRPFGGFMNFVPDNFDIELEKR